MTIPVACFVTRHKPTAAQLRDFAGCRIVQVAYRYHSVRELWLDVLLACGGAPDVLLLTFRLDEYAYAVKRIKKLSPRTVVLKACTLNDNVTPTGLYIEYSYQFGEGVRARGWTPQEAML